MFNDPFYAVTALDHSIGSILFHDICVSNFVALLLTFWLRQTLKFCCDNDSDHADWPTIRQLKFYGSKPSILAACCLFLWSGVFTLLAV